MIGRVFFESVAGGWLPRNPLVREAGVLRPDPMGSSTPVGRRVRLGGLSGFAWSTLSLFVAAGAVYVVGRGSVWYDALDVSLMLTACFFFYAWLSAFAPEARALVRMGVALGVGGALARFSMYLSIRSSSALGYGNAILDLSRMGVFSALALGGLVSVGLAIVAGSRIMRPGLVQRSSFSAGASVTGAGLAGLGFGLSGSGWPSASLASISLTSAGSTIAVLWAAFLSVAFLQPRTAFGRSLVIGAFALQIAVAILIFTRVLWLGT
ncbi:MAG TPA: hypothetical protein VFA17_01305 [Thermoplasmata archaeon]|jgi:hypothetical protein|nr:hypothetical protein [Thermoplasmata archaeon]